MAWPNNSSPSASPPRVLVTGASGFIGHAVCRHLAEAGWQVIGQHWRHTLPAGYSGWRVNLCRSADIALPECEAIVHLAGLAHAPVGECELLWQLNVEATRVLAESAARQHARFIFLSSAKVLGESGEWDDTASPAPASPYARAKLAAEMVVREAAGLAFTILRPPLVFGVGARGNAQRLLAWANSPWPLPLASLTEPRSLIHVDQLAKAIEVCLSSPAAIGQTWLVADTPPLSVAEMITAIRAGLGRPARIFTTSPSLLRGLARLIGHGENFARLSNRFVVHPDGISAALGWQPDQDCAMTLRLWAENPNSSVIHGQTTSTAGTKRSDLR